MLSLTFVNRFFVRRAAFRCIDRLEQDGRICRQKRAAMRSVVQAAPPRAFAAARPDTYQTAYALLCDILAMSSRGPRSPVTPHDWRAACRVAYAMSGHLGQELATV